MTISLDDLALPDTAEQKEKAKVCALNAFHDFESRQKEKSKQLFSDIHKTLELQTLQQRNHKEMLVNVQVEALRRHEQQKAEQQASYKTKPVNETAFKLKENHLKEWLISEGFEQAGNELVNLPKKDYSKSGVFDALKKYSPEFKSIKEDMFKKFWNKQQLAKLERGAKPKNNY